MSETLESLTHHLEPVEPFGKPVTGLFAAAFDCPTSFFLVIERIHRKMAGGKGRWEWRLEINSG